MKTNHWGWKTNQVDYLNQVFPRLYHGILHECRGVRMRSWLLRHSWMKLDWTHETHGARFSSLIKEFLCQWALLKLSLKGRLGKMITLVGVMQELQVKVAVDCASNCQDLSLAFPTHSLRAAYLPSSSNFLTQWVENGVHCEELILWLCYGQRVSGIHMYIFICMRTVQRADQSLIKRLHAGTAYNPLDRRVAG